MTDIEETRQPSEQTDEETFRALEESLYIRLRKALEPRIDALLEARAEYLLPEYYDRVVTSEIRRLEAAIEHNGRRIDELRSYIDQRFNDVDRHPDQVDKRFDKIGERLNATDRHPKVDEKFRYAEHEFGVHAQQRRSLDDRIGRTILSYFIEGGALLGVYYIVLRLILAP